MTIQYITAGDGTVIAWGKEKDPPSDTSCWGASAWTTHPKTPGARHIDRIAADYTHTEMRLAIQEYLQNHAAQPDPEQPDFSH